MRGGKRGGERRKERRQRAKERCDERRRGATRGKVAKKARKAKEGRMASKNGTGKRGEGIGVRGICANRKLYVQMACKKIVCVAVMMNTAVYLHCLGMFMFM